MAIGKIIRWDAEKGIGAVEIDRREYVIRADAIKPPPALSEDITGVKLVEVTISKGEDAEVTFAITYRQPLEPVNDRYNGTLQYGGTQVLRAYTAMAGCKMRFMGAEVRKVRDEMKAEGHPNPDLACACKTHGGSRGVGLRLTSEGDVEENRRFAPGFCEEWVNSHPQEWVEFLDQFRSRNYGSVYPDLPHGF